jgi:hypothetical protein
LAFGGKVSKGGVNPKGFVTAFDGLACATTIQILFPKLT